MKIRLHKLVIFSMILQTALLVFVAHGVVITGSISNSSTNDPVDSASIVFRVGIDPNSYPTVLTDSAGNFLITLALEQIDRLLIMVDKSGFVFTEIEVFITGDSPDTIDIGRNTIEPLIITTVFFTGTIIDWVSGAAIGGAVFEFRRNAATVWYLTCNAKGRFSQTVELSNNINGNVSWSINHDGYYCEVGDITPEMDSVPQMINLKPLGSILFEVKGRVVDSITHAPVENALVLLLSSYHDAKQDSSFTGADGTFVRQVQAGITTSARPELWFTIMQNSLTVKDGSLFLSGLEPIDLGDLEITHNAVKTRYPVSRPKVELNGNKQRTITLNGRILSSYSFETAQNRRSTSASQIVIRVNEKTDSQTRRLPLLR